MTSPSDNVIDVSASRTAIEGRLRFAALDFPCMLGRSGIVSNKREGDGGTPAGVFPLREVRYRPDRMAPPSTKGLPVLAARASDGWCDAPADPGYNRLVQLPYPASVEKIWRDDRLYDLLAVIGYNDAPPISGRGSAIFLHVARVDGDSGKFAPTVGCVSMPVESLVAVLGACSAATRIRIRTI
jgi:L,D-peptidoglycan transpeptidase YkuD (ErfK/YbiS/YcfS/YnhG family)